MLMGKIEVEWEEHGEYEYIRIPREPGTHEIPETRDWWGWDKRFHTYRTRGQVNVSKDGKTSLSIGYHEGDNEKDVKDSIWGKLELSLDPGQSEGTAYWYPFEGAPETRQWRLIPESLSHELQENKNRKNQTVTSRETGFRLAVLEEDGQCVISGENTTASLEAAHIIPVSGNGADVTGNAIMLRADLHRLYDSGYFVIRTDGTVQITEKEDLSNYYHDLLKGAQIDPATLERVHQALKLV